MTNFPSDIDTDNIMDAQQHTASPSTTVEPAEKDSELPTNTIPGTHASKDIRDEHTIEKLDIQRHIFN